ncbi:MAG TPA: Hsp20/alpha crystallin family protein [Parasegetibacter sp.]
MLPVKFNRPRGFQIDSLMNEFLNEFPSVFSNGFRTSGSYPLVNITENEKEYLLELAVPGYTKDQITIRVEDGLLTISGETTQSEEKKEGKFIRKEYSQQSFKRSFTIDEKIDIDGAKAKFENGMLQMVLPKKSDAKPDVKKIEIE